MVANVALTNNRSMGSLGEQIATEYLEGTGYSIIDRNWRGNRCELDLIALDKSCLVFVEVKTRTSARFGTPIEAVTPAKLDNMTRAAFAWLSAHRIQHRAIRFDVVGVLIEGIRPKVTHVRGVGQ